MLEKLDEEETSEMPFALQLAEGKLLQRSGPMDGEVGGASSHLSHTSRVEMWSSGSEKKKDSEVE